MLTKTILSEKKARNTVKNKFLFSNSQKKEKVDAELKSLIKLCCNATTERFRVESPCEISVTFVDNEEIREINNDTRGVDRATDVLSFPMNEMANGEFAEEPEIDEKGVILLGDIVLSLEKARAQAEEYGHSFTREVAFLCVHSMLHLLGFDHMTPDDEKEMFSIQEDILTELNIVRE